MDISIKKRMLSVAPGEYGGMSELARQIGISPQSISQYLHGQVRAPLYVIARYADLLDVSLTWLLVGDDDRDPSYRLGFDDTADDDASFSVATRAKNSPRNTPRCCDGKTPPNSTRCCPPSRRRSLYMQAS